MTRGQPWKCTKYINNNAGGRICEVRKTVPNKKVPGLHVMAFTLSFKFLPVTSLSHCDSIANPTVNITVHCSCHNSNFFSSLQLFCSLSLLAVWESLFFFHGFATCSNRLKTDT